MESKLKMAVPYLMVMVLALSASLFLSPMWGGRVLFWIGLAVGAFCLLGFIGSFLDDKSSTQEGNQENLFEAFEGGIVFVDSDSRASSLDGRSDFESLIQALEFLPDWRVRKAAAEELGQKGGSRGVDPLIGALADRNKNVRAAAAEALGYVGDARAIEPLIAASNDRTLLVREAAATTLNFLGVTAEDLAASDGPESNLKYSVVSFSWDDADDIIAEMGEMYFQCPKCRVHERVNNVGALMLRADPNHLKTIACVECGHTYDARACLTQGECPGWDYSDPANPVPRV
jgi:hypothetical protein